MATMSIPQSLQVEHRAIHEALEAAIKAPGRTGAAAREVAAVLGPHFKREDEIALPPLGLLAPLARGERPAGMSEALAMSDALRKELPRMLAEHKQIRAATETLRAAAREEKATVHAQFAEELLRHAQSEEEVLYPAAVLVGDNGERRRPQPARDRPGGGLHHRRGFLLFKQPLHPIDEATDGLA